MKNSYMFACINCMTQNREWTEECLCLAWEVST